MFWLILKPKLSFEVRYSIQLILQEMQRHVAHAEANSQTLTKCSASTPEPETQIGEKWKWKEKWETSCSCNWHWPNVLAQRSLSHKFLLTVFENTLSQANLFLALNETVFGINYISGGHWHCAKIMCDPISISSICFRWIKPKMPDFFCHLFSLSLFTHCLFKLLR